MTDQAALTATHVAGPMWTIQGQPLVVPPGADAHDLVTRKLFELADGRADLPVVIRHGGQLTHLRVSEDGSLVPAPGGSTAAEVPEQGSEALRPTAGDRRLWMRSVAASVDPLVWGSFVRSVLTGTAVDAKTARQVGDAAWTVRQAVTAAIDGPVGRDQLRGCLPTAFSPYLPWLGTGADVRAVARALKVRRRVAAERLAEGELLLQAAELAVVEVQG